MANTPNNNGSLIHCKTHPKVILIVLHADNDILHHFSRKNPDIKGPRSPSIVRSFSKGSGSGKTTNFEFVRLLKVVYTEYCSY